MDRLEAMSLLLDVTDAGSFSAAARRRGMSVATLTRRIGQLEHHLGAVLMLRSTRRLALTDAGQRFVAGARTILAQVDEIEREAAGEFSEPTGRLVVSAPRMFGRLHVLPIVEAFLRDHPGISVDLRLADDNVDLSAGAADLAVRIGALADSSLVASRVGTMRLVTAASPRLFESASKPDHPRDLQPMPSIALDIPMPWAAGSPFADRAAARVRARLVVSSAEAAVDAAVAGVGVIHLLHYQVAEAVAAGRLTLLLEAFEAPPVPVHILHAPLGQLPLKMRRFRDVAGSGLRTALARLAQA
ncbi:MAG: LysR family transcriptional regulator [Mesorhizobium amorphae]|nr:MAG: LysR family transcriptional regulator [Mesorhizobium amorphae]